ncbi:MAG TPA: EAL domain-containing protein [Actinomycetes bacterium]
MSWFAPSRSAGSRAIVTGAGGLLASGPVLHLLGLDVAADLATRATVAAATALAVLLLVRRARPEPPDRRRPWLLLVAATLAEGAWAVLLGEDVGPSALGSLGHLVAGPLLAVALWGLPAPVECRKSWVSTALDAATAWLASAIATWELFVADEGAAGWAWLGLMADPLVNVAVVTSVVAVLARARRPGGLAFGALAGLCAGAALLAAAGTAARHGVAPGLVSPVLAAGLLAVALGAWLPPEGVESELVSRSRERVAVLVPLAPLAVAAAVLLSALLLRVSLSPVALVCAALLAAALVGGAVLARLESLAVERSLDDLVVKRTMTLGTREKWFRSLVRNSSDVITVVDVRGVVRYQTPSVTRILGHDPQLLVGTRITGLMRPADGRKLEAALAAAARNPGRPVTLEFPIWHQKGRWCDTETTITSLVHDPDIRGLVLNSRDVSERRQLEEQLTQQAYSDALTGLANRAFFRTRVEEALAQSFAAAEVAVLFLDLDGFKGVNDAQGHHVGDELLGLVGKRLAHSVRPGDVVARLGGDEFAILVTGPDAEEAAVWVAERVRRSLASPFVLDGRELALGASTGIAVSDRGDETADQLLRNADLAMYRAKARRDLGFVRFESQMHDALMARMQAESDLRHAVANGDLVLHYQPVVELGSGRIVGVEALVRWAHHERGLVSPGEFIELAEETGLVSDIGSWAILECCRQGARWQRYAGPGGVFKVAVNVSARQLTSALPRQVRDALVETGVPGSALTLEMTESVLMERTDEVVELLRRMKTMGVKVAVDDFGTGYSSLSYLSRFPVDILKIDRSFVQHIGSDCTEQGELAGTIVRLGESLRLETVAEGIETEHQREILARMGCTFGQGYLFARPMPADELDAVLAEQQPSAVTA